MPQKPNLIMERAKEYIAKIEGHGSLTINWEKGLVKLNVLEGERLFEGILVGKTLEEMHWITPRICGVCPIAHNLASLASSEAALGIKISNQTKLLRRLMQIGQNVQSHILHAVFLALPDYIGIDRITELNQKDPKKFAMALALKEIGDEIAYVVAGRNVHPTQTTVGGFHKIPNEKELRNLQDKIKRNIPKARALLQIFKSLNYPRLKVDLELLTQQNGKVISNKRAKFKISDYKKNIEEEVRNGSTAKFGAYKGGEYMVGSMARLYHGPHQKIALQSGLDFQNPFHNNLAQIMETVFELEDGIKIIEELLRNKLNNLIAKPSKNPPLRGVGAVEAPRGGLYHEVRINKNGVITYANIITPTVQNLTSMETSATTLLKQYPNASQKELKHLIEMLIRAYDPCITCSVH
ncbi:MAG: Ni/Fe hydrogenase subunit alpha [Candidatus Niyogibacteria bacterium]|nr:Ni/Fe hydrogenase subunit alpha [Candidatus Niyogibacteria bacterium]